MRPTNIAMPKVAKPSEAVLALARMALCSTKGVQPSMPLVTMAASAPSVPSASTAPLGRCTLPSPRGGGAVTRSTAKRRDSHR
jgi:hypothetical protein